MQTHLQKTLMFMVGGLLTLVGCGGAPPENPPAEGLVWKSYSNPAAPYSLEYPVIYVAKDDGGGVRFRYDGYPVVILSYATREQAKDHGLWAAHESIAEITLGGHKGKKYIYNHYDGPFFMRTVSYVVEHQGKYIALEFRTDRKEPDDVQTRILNSLQIN